MKKYFLLFSLFIFAFSSCRKVVDTTVTTFDANAQAVTDEAAIQTYLKANPSVNVTKDPSGLYYQILAPGTGTHPVTTSNITVNYTAVGLDATAYEKNPSIYFTLSSRIAAWQVGIPKLGTGGTILMIVPSALGFGNANSNSIPANTVIIYTVTLQGFNNTPL